MNSEEALKTIVKIYGETEPDKLVQAILDLRNNLAEAYQDIDIERQRSDLYKIVTERILAACVRIVIEGEKDVRAKYFGPRPADDITAIWKRIEADVSFEKELRATTMRLAGEA